MQNPDLALIGNHIRLEPMERSHVDALLAAAAGDPSLYRWTPVPHTKPECIQYISTALESKAAGTAIPFATIRMDDDVVIGSTRFWNIERWAWPAGHPRHDQSGPDACEIGYTWLSHSAIRTAANTETKLLMLTHAFEVWNVLRVCFHTDARNQRSRDALQRIGGQFEGILRVHRLAVDHIPRDSARFSIIASEWPSVKQRLTARLEGK